MFIRTQSSQFVALSPLMAKLAGAVLRVVRGMWRRRRNRLAARELLTWSDYMLADIGLTRDDVREALRSAPPVEPTTRLRIRAVERRAAARARSASAPDAAPEGAAEAARDARPTCAA